MMRSLAIVGVVLVIFVSVLGFGIYRATKSVPEFYEIALAADPADQKAASSEMFNRSNRLYRQAKERGTWQALFTAEQINGFLAIDLQQKFPELLPGEIRDPRVAIRPGSASLGCRYESSQLSTVLSIETQVYLAGPDVVAVRIEGARAGALPLPLSDVLESISEAARVAELPLVWKQEEGDPVALLTIPPPRDARNRAITLETLELRSGEIFLTGRTGDDVDATRRPGGRENGVPVAIQSASIESVQH